MTDRGSEYKGQVANHAYALFLSVEGITHTTPKAYSPQTNGMCERFNKTLKQEFFDTAMRKKIYTSLSELQSDLDEWLCYYNGEGRHSGKYCYGKGPLQTFRDTKGLGLAKHHELMFYKEASESAELTDKKLV